jgi:hypothetical protein
VTAPKPISIADVYCRNVAGIETATTTLGRLPLAVAMSAFDPDLWCAVVIHPGAVEAAGSFRDVASPLREWLLRAASSGHPIGMHGPGEGLPSSEAIPKSETTGIAADCRLLTESGLPPLVPSARSARPDWLADSLQALAARSFGCAVKSQADAVALAAGLWQMNDFLDRSHELAQSVEGRGKNRAGDYWHAIMHRREPDYSNAKYWLRRVGPHGIHASLARDADSILSTCNSVDAPRWRTAITAKGRQKWDALAFVDFCEELADSHDVELSLAARQIQLIEMALLLSSTYHDAFG